MTEFNDFIKEFNKKYKELPKIEMEILKKHISIATGSGGAKSEQILKLLLGVLLASHKKLPLSFKEIQKLSNIQKSTFEDFDYTYLIEEDSEGNYRMSGKMFIENINTILMYSLDRYQKDVNELQTFLFKYVWPKMLGTVYPKTFQISTFAKIVGEVECYQLVKDLFEHYHVTYIYSDLLWAGYPDEDDGWSGAVKLYYETIRKAIEQDKNIHVVISLQSHLDDLKSDLKDIEKKSEQKDMINNMKKYLQELSRFNKYKNVVIRTTQEFVGLTIIAFLNKDKTKGEVLVITDIGEPAQQPVIRVPSIEMAQARASWHEFIEKGQNNEAFNKIVSNIKNDLKGLK